MDLFVLQMMVPYLNCFLALLVGILAGVVLSLLARRGKISSRLRDRLTVYISLGVWLVLTILLWVVDENNPITNRINGGGSLS